MIDIEISEIVTLILSAAIAWLGFSIFRLSSTKPKKTIISSLNAHNDAIQNILDSEDGRKALARMVIYENALSGFIEDTYTEATELKDPEQVIENQGQEEKRGWKRYWEKAKSLGKPVTDAVFGKANSYLKKYVGADDGDS